MGLDVVHADAQHLRLEGLELREAFAESDHLRRADEGEVGRIEEEDDPLPAELRQRDAARPAGVRSLQGEGWRRRVQVEHAIASPGRDGFASRPGPR